MERQEQLLGLKQKILTSLTPLVLEGDGSPEEKLESALSLIELGNVSTSLYEKSIDTANEIQDVSLKTDYLMRLLGAVQSDLSNQAGPDEDTESAGAQNVASQPEVHQSNTTENQNRDNNQQ